MHIHLLLLLLVLAVDVAFAAAAACPMTTIKIGQSKRVPIPKTANIQPQSALCTSTKMVRYRFRAPKRGVYVLDATASECSNVFLVVSRAKSTCIQKIAMTADTRCLKTDYYMVEADAKEWVTILLGGDADKCAGKSVTLRISAQDSQAGEYEYEFAGLEESDSPTSDAPSSAAPSQSPTIITTLQPTRFPTKAPTTQSPSALPTISPSALPTMTSPTASPTFTSPTASPTMTSPTASPTMTSPTASPSLPSPTASPSLPSPTASPSLPSPTASPTLASPTASPSEQNDDDIIADNVARPTTSPSQ